MDFASLSKRYNRLFYPLPFPYGKPFAAMWLRGQAATLNLPSHLGLVVPYGFKGPCPRRYAPAGRTKPLEPTFHLKALKTQIRSFEERYESVKHVLYFLLNMFNIGERYAWSTVRSRSRDKIAISL